MKFLMGERWSKRLSTWARVLALGAGLVAGASSANAADYSSYWDASCTCYRNVPWGRATWTERTLQTKLKQDFDLFVPTNAPPGPRPVVVWAHANGSTKTITVGDSVYKRIVLPALNNGFIVVSIEFRHPVVNDYLGVYHYDVGLAIQALRSAASDFNLDNNNFFLAGRSRGVLGLWTALQDDMANPNGNLQEQQSSRVNAVFGYQGETTYSTTEAANTFIVPQDRARFMKRNPDNPLWGSALQSASADDPPLLLRYEDPFWYRLVRMTEFTTHHSDFGLEMCKRYTDLGIGDRCTAEDMVAGSQAYVNYINFFIANLKPSVASAKVSQ